MATQQEGDTPASKVQLVACTFVERYYNVLYDNPNVVHKFYEDSSTITRPDLIDGKMSSVSTMLGIKDKILSLDYHSRKAEIVNIDAQESCNKSIIVLVTGFLIGEDESKRSFMQSFLLATHATGYFVLNDIFRFGIVENEKVVTSSANALTETDTSIPLTKESTQVSDEHAEGEQSGTVPEIKSNGLKNPSPPLKGSVDKKGLTLKQVVTSCEKQTTDPPKMSYASMLAKASPVSSPVKRSTNAVVVVGPSANSYLDKITPAPQQAPPPRRNNNTLPSGDSMSDGKSIYVGHLPSDIPAEDLEKVFSEYGRIRKDGIQIKTYDDGFCYAFVEFESTDAARKAIEVHTFWFGTYKSYVTGKRSSSQGNGNVKMRQASGKGEFRNTDSIRRIRENSVEGRHDGWNQNSNRGDYGSNRGAYNNRNRNDSQFQSRGPNEFSGQNRWRNDS